MPGPAHVGAAGVAAPVTVASAACWGRACDWHATGTDLHAIDQAVKRHTRWHQCGPTLVSFPLSGATGVLVGFHECDQYNKDQPDTPGRPCGDAP